MMKDDGLDPHDEDIDSAGMPPFLIVTMLFVLLASIGFKFFTIVPLVDNVPGSVGDLRGLLITFLAFVAAGFFALARWCWKILH